MCACYLLCRHSNGSAEDHNDDGDDHADDGGSLSRSGSEDNVAQIQNGHNNNNNGYTHKSMLKKKKKKIALEHLPFTFSTPIHLTVSYHFYEFYFFQFQFHFFHNFFFFCPSSIKFSCKYLYILHPL